MAPPRTFDYDVLNQVIRDHPDRSNIWYAEVITDYERRTRNDPGYPDIKPNAIARAISNMRRQWEAEGKPIRDRPRGRLVPWPGLTHKQLMSTPLRHIKVLETLKLHGDGAVSDRAVRQAREFENRLTEQRRVIDIDDNGNPYERPARPDELDDDGALKKLTADVRPEWLARVSGIDAQEEIVRRLEVRRHHVQQRGNRAS